MQHLASNAADELLTVEELSAEIKVPEGTIRQWVKLRKIPHVKLGNKLTRFRRSAIREWLDRQEREALAA